MIDNRFAPYDAFTIRAALGLMFIAHAYLFGGGTLLGPGALGD